MTLLESQRGRLKLFPDAVGMAHVIKNNPSLASLISTICRAAVVTS